MPDKMPGWYGLQIHDNGELVACQIDLSEFYLSGALKRVIPLNNDGEQYGYIVCYTPNLDDMRYYMGPNGPLAINWPQMYYRVPFAQVPEHEYENLLYAGAMYRPKPPEPSNPQPFERWWWEVSDKIGDPARNGQNAYSVCYAGDGRGFFIGCYDVDRYMTIYRTDEWGNIPYKWYERWRGAGFESVSFPFGAPNNNGMNFGTEEMGGPWLYWAPDFDASKMSPSAFYGNGMMYALGRQGCRQTGNLVCIGSNRNVGGKLAKYNNGWPLFTSEMRDTDGHPLLPWDAIFWNGRYIAGCARTMNGEYKDFHAGRLAILEGSTWQIKKLSPEGTAGIISLTMLPHYDPDRLYLTTLYGEVWRTHNLIEFEKIFTVEGDVVGKDVSLFEIEGPGGWRPVAVSAWGHVYENWQKVLDFRPAFWGARDFASVVPGPAGLFGGPINVGGEKCFKFLRLRYE